LSREKNTALADKAYRIMKSRIINLVLCPGTVLSESELAKSLKMSRSPIRTALQRLKHEGFVTTKPRVGHFVKVFTREEVKEMQEMQEALESMAIKIATEKISEKDFREAVKIIESMEDALRRKDTRSWIMADEKFHALIPKIAGNELIMKSLGAIWDQNHQVRLITMTIPELRKKSTDEYRQMIEAMRERNSKRAREIVQIHWERVRKNTAERFSL